MDDPWMTHEWVRPIRVLKINGQSKREYFCIRCKRSFVELMGSHEYFAAVAGVLDFDPLPSNVTIQWLTQECPGRELPEDAEVYRKHWRVSIPMDARRTPRAAFFRFLSRIEQVLGPSHHGRV